MQICRSSDRLSRVMFWAGMAITPFSIVSSGHGRLQHFVIGAAMAMLVVGLVRLRSCVRG